METLDDLLPGGLKIIQSRRGYRYSLDPVLLADFVAIPAGARVVDLGTGSGIIPLLLAIRTAAGTILGVEIQSELAERARRSVVLNGLEKRIDIITADLRQPHPDLAPQGFDVVLTNPPYRPPGRGRQAPENERAAARHELAGGLPDFLAAAARLLGDGGRFGIVYLAERMAELLAEMRTAGLEPKRLRCVHARAGKPARLVLVEGRRRGGPGLVIESPLYVYEGEGYSGEIRRILWKGEGLRTEARGTRHEAGDLLKSLQPGFATACSC